MLHRYLSKSSIGTRHPRLILIFAGWSTTPEFYSSLVRKGWDTLVVYDYSDSTFDTAWLDGYETIYLYAWSLGVFMASGVLDNAKITAAYAINGTLTPVDDSCGIPQAIYTGTMENLSERNLMKFRRRMAGTKENYERLTSTSENTIERYLTIEGLQNQLRFIAESVCTPSPIANPIRWRRAYMAQEDAIFPYQNQLNAWEKEGVPTVSLEEPHVPDFNAILRETIPQPELIGKSFEKASSTYDDTASAQAHIAETLAAKIREAGISKCDRIVEIGPGTGLLTRKYAQFIKAAEVVFIDLATMPAYALFDNEVYIQGDAEEVMHHQLQPESADAIVSASVLQWFVNPRRFIANAAKILKKGGTLILSTFGEDNMKELNGIRRGLHYPSVAELTQWLGEYFKEVEVSEERIIIPFTDGRRLLLHLKHTGVSGSFSKAPETPLRLTSLSSINSLTYHPIYIVARK